MNIFKRWYRDWKWKHTRSTNFDYLRKEWRGDVELHGKYDVTVKRRFQSDELYVDLYWIIKTHPEDYPVHEHTVYRRCSWDNVMHSIEKMERRITEGTF